MTARARLRIDPWAAEYDGAQGQLDFDAPTATVDVRVEHATWQAVRPALRSGPPPQLSFVDGVRRIDCRFVVEADGRSWPGLFGSVAVGCAVATGRAAITGERVGHVAPCARPLPDGDLTLQLGKVRIGYVHELAADDSPDAPLRALQNAMRRLEAEVAASLPTVGDAVFVDGPLAATMPAGPFVGYVKRLLRSYLDPAHQALLPDLAVGDRTPLFLVQGAPHGRFSWYQRIGTGRAIDAALAGVVRCECAQALGLATARLLADLAARELPRFAGDPVRDPRAPQNLHPIGALELHLRHRLGDALVVRRAIEAQVHAAMT